MTSAKPPKQTPAKLPKHPARRRGYDRRFPSGETFDRYLLDRIPVDLWRQVRSRSRRESISIRSLLLQMLSIYVDPSIVTTLLFTREAR